GALQSERSIVYPVLLIGGVVWLGTIHFLAGRREVQKDFKPESTDDWFDAGIVEEIQQGRGKAVALPGRERVAIFRYGNKISAVTNLCAHQGGPLGEGRIIDGCITCPWHGYTYRPGDGCAPPPFTEKIETYEVRVRGHRVWLNPDANAKGTAVEPALIAEARDE